MSYLPPGLPAGFNQTLLNNTDLCTLQTCPLSLANFTYVPTLFGNVLFAAIFGLALIIQIILAVKYRGTWGYGVAMVFGLVLEVIGYVARIQMHYNPFTSDPFLMYLVCLTIAPAFLSAAIYLCLSRIVIVYSESISRFKPATYTVLFICCDFVSLLLQAVGGGIASAADTESLGDIGKNIMVAGVSWQVASMILFAGLCLDFYLRVRRTPESQRNLAFTTLRAMRRFRFFLLGLALATFTIFVRSVFRCAELSGGFHGPLANQQVTFMILEGAMICIAVICLTILHPGVVFKADWDRAAWKVRSRKAGLAVEGKPLGGDSNYALVDSQEFSNKHVTAAVHTTPPSYEYSPHRSP